MYLWQVKNKISHTLDIPDQNQFGWYIQSLDCGAYYLHTDGQMKWGADKSDEGTTGYFKTYREAWEAGSKYATNN